MIAAPHNYSEWVKVLEVFCAKSNDSEVLQAMKLGTLEWQTGVAERFVKRLTDAFNGRMNAAVDKFQKEQTRGNRSESALIQNLLCLRKEMAFLAQAMDLPVLPEEDRHQYIQLIYAQADAIQTSLEESAKKERSGKLASIVRNHKVNSF